MSLHDLIESDAVTVFCNTNDFAESVTYYPRSGSTRPINAVVMREPIATFTETGGQVNLQSFQVHVANDSTNGISGTELDLGGDEIAIPPRDGMAAARKAVMQIVGQDHGMLVLECR